MSPQSPSNSSISTDDQAGKAGKNPAAAFGPNEWLVDEIYQQYLQDPNSVDRAWWDFADYKPGGVAALGHVAYRGRGGRWNHYDGSAAPAPAPAPARWSAQAAGSAAPAAPKPQPPHRPRLAPAKPRCRRQASRREGCARQGCARQGPRPRVPRPACGLVPLRGPAAAAKNMNASLELPTATSVRAVR